MTTVTRTALAFSMTLVLAACDGNGPMAPAGGIRGTYAGTWTLRLTEVSSGASFEIPCPGSITINDESATTLNGSWVVNSAADCDSASGTFQGTRSNREITIVLNPDPFDTFEDEVEECTVLTRDDDFSGSVGVPNTGARSVFFNGSLTADCDSFEGVLRFRFTLLFAGTRGGGFK